ncbi:uncharacterized protein PRCAT00005403001 [Priceomyces carsonii]|uniref:uncharacterized protein n=1 Tax=Priceomyces carsonii TaxID=28549 RepID=UPI002EDB0FAA|nr:unnamed protein product [Priceomyces carsonii]
MTFVTILTGASRGIGAAIAEGYLNESKSNCLIAVARTKPSLSKLVDTYGGDRVGIVVGDVCDPQTSASAIELAVKKFGKLNAIIANAGVLDPVEHIENADLDKWRKLYDINFFSVVGLVQQALPELRKTNGRVVAVLSGASETAYDGWGAYGSSKAALNQFINSLAFEEPSVSAISIAPGVVDTEMQSDIRSKFGTNMTKSIEKFMDLHESKRLLDPRVPGNVYWKLALKGWESNLNGKYLRFDDELLKYL